MASETVFPQAGAVLDVERLRAGFPGLDREVGGRPAVFADAPGGTQALGSVIEAMAGYLRRSNANVGGAFVTSEETDRVIADARRAGADLFGCDADEVIFGPNSTTINLHLSRSIVRELSPSDELVVTHLDHDANVAPWLLAAEEAGATVRWADIDPEDCTLRPEHVAPVVGPATKVVAFTAASNAVGTVTSSREIIAAVRRAAPGAIVVLDAVHLAPHRLIDAAALGADIVLTSPYKYFGPHLGAAYLRADLRDRLVPYKVRPAHDEGPDRWETGTQNHEALAGFAACVEHLRQLGGGGGREAIVRAMELVAAHEERLSRRFLEGLAGLPAELYGIADPSRAGERTPTFAVTVEGLAPRAVAERLGERGIFVWDGNYYALALMERLGLEERGGAVRIGFCQYHSEDEVERVLGGLAAVAKGP